MDFVNAAHNAALIVNTEMEGEADSEEEVAAKGDEPDEALKEKRSDHSERLKVDTAMHLA